MDATTEYLSDCTYRLTYENLSAEVIHQVKRTLIDTLGCGVGAFDSEPPSIARRMASRVQGNPPARILGTSQETSTDLAAFANTVLIRYLDCNDAYAARGTGHPSDMIPGVLAVAGGHRLDGRAHPSKDGMDCGSTWGSRPRSGNNLVAEPSSFGSPVPASRRTRR